MRNLKLVESRDKVKIEATKVGQAVYDSLLKTQEEIEVGEMTEAMTPKYFEELKIAIKNGTKAFEPPFYVVVLRQKEFWALNVVRHRYVTRQSRPSPKTLREDFPNADHDVWMIDPRVSQGELQWTLPTKQDSASILKAASVYDPQLVKWIQDFDSGLLV